MAAQTNSNAYRLAATAVLAQRSLLDFATIVRPNYRANWHHKILIQHIEALCRRDIQRLLVMMPPGHGKSELVSRILPAWYPLTYPDHNMIAASHTYGLAVTMSLDAKNIIQSEAYQPIPAALGLKLKKSESSRAKDTEHLWQVPFGHGRYIAAGVRKGITGQRFNLGIIDDPIKDAADAYSPTIREAIWKWYTTVFSTRQAPRAVQLVTHTRWHPDDLAGRLLQQSASEWTVLELPGLFELPGSDLDPRTQPNEALWPSMYSADELLKQQLLLGEAAFDALYQQRPTLPSANVFAAAFRRSQHVQNLEYDRNYSLLLSFDFNVDPVTCLIGQRVDDMMHVLDEISISNSDIFGMFAEIRERLHSYPDAHILVTGDAAGYSRQLATQGLQNFYQMAAQQVGFSMAQVRTPLTNPTHIQSRSQTNLLFRLGKILIDPKCKGLLYDMEHVQVNEAQSIVKARRSDLAQRADLLDAARYLWNTFYPSREIRADDIS